MSTAPSYKPVTIDKDGGQVTLKVSNPNSPQMISGITEEYIVLANLPINTYSFSTSQPESILGNPAAVSQHYYAISGSVLNSNDDPPTQYQVEIVIMQDGKQLDLVHKPENGPGQISDTDMPFLHRFQLVTA